MFYDEKPSLEDLIHYGTPRHSGRYPWGSGKDPYQRSEDFLSRVNELKKQGLSEKEIADAVGLTTTQLRVQKSLAKDEQRTLMVDRVRSLREDGLSTNKIAEKMGIAESSVRSLLNTESEARMNAAKKTAEFLKKQVDEKGMIDVGAGVERELGISKEKLTQALYILEREGYNTFGGGVPQVTNPGKQTNIQVLCPPDTPYKVTENGKKVSSAIYDYANVHSVSDYISYDGGETFKKAFVYPSSMDSKRLKIRYAEDGGINKDGVIELRRGVKDLDLGNSHYAQVRIMVDGTHYLKGMAIYSDGKDMPDGVDVIFNTNKHKNVSKMDVLKKIKNDPDNPFGALIKEHGGQSYYVDKDGKEKLSLINKTREEGDWETWSKKLPSQFLAKQNLDLINKQLTLTKTDKKAEFDEICSLNNPTVKKILLKSFADDCDAAAVHLKAAALPRQKYQVILPLTTIKDDQVYAPNYRDGEKVALVRYPHGGTFEIPILTVNNKHTEGRRVLGTTPSDAIGISSKVAERLSGADFDGDTVMVIPTGKNIKITSTPPLKGLKDFDAKMEYPERKGMKYMKNTQTEMGKISNLITDMTLKGAKQDELSRAVRHSMVVIDAEKHKLDYKKSEADNGIAALKKKYQGTVDDNGRYHEGASTLLSRAKSKEVVLKRKGSPIIDPITGEQSYKEVHEEYIDKKTGKTKVRTQNSTKMAEAKDAYSLVSDANTPQERAYASYANYMKALANQARKEMISTGNIKYSPSAKATYQKEVDSLMAKLNVSLKNAPRERHAQVIANAEVNAKKKSYPDMTKEELKKAKQRALVNARIKVGAERKPIEITDKEWEAIQAGAISENKLSQIINHTDIDKLRERATPRAKTTLSPAKISKASAMKSSGYTTAEIAKALGVSSSTVTKYLNR